MTENKRFEVYDDGFSKHIEDTYYTEDKHEHNLYDVWEMCRKLNELYEENKWLKEEIKELLAKNDDFYHKRVIDLIDDRISNFSNVKVELLLNSDDDYRLEKVSFAIQNLRELKKELENDCSIG